MEPPFPEAWEPRTAGKKDARVSAVDLPPWDSLVTQGQQVSKPQLTIIHH